MSDFKPMLSGKAPDNLSKIRFPIYVSPKYDGIRAMVINGRLISRNLKMIPNRYTQERFCSLEGFDGELIVGNPTDPDCFRKTSSGVMSRDGEPDVKFYVFDKIMEGYNWMTRIDQVNRIVYDLAQEDDVFTVPQYVCNNVDTLLELEEQFLTQGYEGVMIRSGAAPYKYGRSTTKEGGLLKLKRFEDSEAIVIGMEERMHNANEATTNALGHTERTSHQENLVPTGTMGALIVRDLKTNIEFNIGTGFDDDERDWWWARECMGVPEIMNNGGKKKIGLMYSRIVKYKYFPTGSKDKPRFPTYLGLRDLADM